ncbi:MAG TPA: GNAT family N-acyltransferase [Tepidisphaeraceae bacterium]|jgi:putative hemolysin|nr:GNAT family N-acyltransferase [Tepidisphaeraceae bacterium]
MPTRQSDRSSPKPFTFNPPVEHPLGRRILPAVAPAMERLFRLDALNALWDRCTRAGDEQRFMDRVLDDLGIRYRLAAEDLARIPKTGPVVVVCNHPFGALDGMILAALLTRIRPDVKIMANYLLGRIPDTRDLFLLVDPFGGKDAARTNLRPLRQAIQCVQAGGMLAIFPAGEVAHADLRTREVTEPAWSTTVARIARKAGAPVLPLYFHGQNSTLFQLLGLLHPKLRTAMLPRELFKKRAAAIEVRVGSSIAHRKFCAVGDDRQIADFLRQRTLLLRHRSTAPQISAPPHLPGDVMAPIALPGCARVHSAEVAALGANQLLADNGDMAVYRAAAGQIPHLLQEIGRLREITFRATNEGTGKARDLDRFDNWYTHLFVWHKTRGEIVGAYRLGITDEIVAERGTAGLYTSTLFKYRAGLVERMGPAIELGRSFIRLEYQRSYAALLLLWKGIGRIVVERPQCKALFGPVSISNDYQTSSKHLMVQFLAASHYVPDLAELTRPRHPFRPPGMKKLTAQGRLNRLLSDSDAVDDVVAELEPDGKGMPVLLRQYLKLGARFFAFNVDPDFSDALDALMLVDLTKTDRKLLQRYMGEEGMGSFLRWHKVE